MADILFSVVTPGLILKAPTVCRVAGYDVANQTVDLDCDLFFLTAQLKRGSIDDLVDNFGRKVFLRLNGDITNLP